VTGLQGSVPNTSVGNWIQCWRHISTHS